MVGPAIEHDQPKLQSGGFFMATFKPVNLDEYNVYALNSDF